MVSLCSLVGWLVFFSLSFLYAFFPVDRRWSTLGSRLWMGIVSAHSHSDVVAILGNTRDGEVKYDKRTSAIFVFHIER